MSKPTVHYRGPVEFLYGCAFLYPVDHPSLSNRHQAWTSEVVFHDQDTGLVETRNTIYIPIGTP